MTFYCACFPHHPQSFSLLLSPCSWDRPSYSRIFFAVLAIPPWLSRLPFPFVSFLSLFSSHSISHNDLSFLSLFLSLSLTQQTEDFSSNPPLRLSFAPPIFTHVHSYSCGLLLYHGVSTVLSVSGTSAGWMGLLLRASSITLCARVAAPLKLSARPLRSRWRI